MSNDVIVTVNPPNPVLVTVQEPTPVVVRAMPAVVLNQSGGALPEIHRFGSGDATPAPLGNAFTGLLQGFVLAIQDAFTGLVKITIGVDEFTFPGEFETSYQVRLERDVSSLVPTLTLSGVVVGEFGKGYVELLKR